MAAVLGTLLKRRLGKGLEDSRWLTFVTQLVPSTGQVLQLVLDREGVRKQRCLE